MLSLAVLLLGTASACYSLAAPAGWADPVFDGQVVYYSPTHGKLEAYDQSAKKVLWDFPSAQQKQLKVDAVYSTPVLDPQSTALYLGTYSGWIYSLNRTNGQMNWTVNSGSAIIGGLLLDNGVLYLGNTDGHVLALQASDGKKLWQETAGQRVWSTPIVANGLIVVTSMDSDVYAFHPQGGIAWKASASSAAIASTPRIDDSHLTFGGFDKRYHAIDDQNGDTVWSSPPAGNWFWTQGLISGDNLYAGNLDGHLYVYNPTDGSFKWQVDIGSPVRSAPVLVNGVLIVAGRDGQIHGLDPQSGKDMWPAINAGGEVLANLIVSPAKTVYALTQPGSKNGARLLQIDPTNGSSSNIVAQ